MTDGIDRLIQKKLGLTLEEAKELRKHLEPQLPQRPRNYHEQRWEPDTSMSDESPRRLLGRRRGA